MDNLETSFLGLKIETEGPSKEIKVALGSSMELLDIEKFMVIINFEKDPVM